jgi:predicted RNA-binding Zn-ribbon protein involved in translation (DUF1610 family)
VADDDENILEITWEDLRDVPATPEQFPSVDAALAEVAASPGPWLEVTAVCARTRQAFGVRFRQDAPGVYSFGGVFPAPLAEKGSPATAGAGLIQVNARFDLAGYPGCPHCGLPGLVQCDQCGTITCGSGVYEDKRGTWSLCPQCGSKGQVASDVAITVQGRVGGAKGKLGKGR